MDKRPGFEYIITLPEGFDGRTRIAAYNDKVIVTHPENPPLVYAQDGKLIMRIVPNAIPQTD